MCCISLTNTEFMDFTGRRHCAVLIFTFAAKQVDILQRISKTFSVITTKNDKWINNNKLVLLIHHLYCIYVLGWMYTAWCPSLLKRRNHIYDSRCAVRQLLPEGFSILNLRQQGAATALHRQSLPLTMTAITSTLKTSEVKVASTQLLIITVCVCVCVCACEWLCVLYHGVQSACAHCRQQEILPSLPISATLSCLKTGETKRSETIN